MGHAVRWNELWTERRPHPLAMTDTEILDWMNEYCDEVTYKLPTPNNAGGFTVKCYGIKTTATTMRGAICLAAAKWEELNK